MWPSTGSRGGSRTGPRIALLRVLEGRRPNRIRAHVEGPDQGLRPDLYADGPSGIIPLDLSDELGISDGPATSPALVANSVRIPAGERIATNPNATSQLYYVISGRGFSAVNGRLVRWEKGNLDAPADSHATFHADAGSDAVYWVNDEPFLRHLGAEATEPRFRATKFRRADAVARLEEIASRPNATTRAESASCWPMPRRSRHDDHSRLVGDVRSAAAGSGAATTRNQSVALDLILTPSQAATRCGHPVG